MTINTFSAEIYIQRRNQLMNLLTGGRILLFGNRDSSMNFKDNIYPFKQDSTFLYFGGLNLPDIDIIIDVDKNETILFGNESTIEHVIWTGVLPTLKELAERVGITKVLPSKKLGEYCKDELHYLPPYRPEHVLRLFDYIGIHPDLVEQNASVELIEAIIKLRNSKSDEEIKSLHEACTITSRMHRTVMESTKPGMFEYEVVGIAQSFVAAHNVPFSFPPICTKNGHILHNHNYSNQLAEGDLMLFDGGAESILAYAGDMTRTFPVSRRFSAIQADLYQIVLQAHKNSAKSMKIGKKFLDIHLIAAKEITKGLSDLGIIKGDIEEAVNAGAHTLFFPHGLGHMMGLDVHDMENLGEEYVGYGNGMVKSKEFGLKSLRLGRPLEAGFVMTIEPGLYLIPALIDKFESEHKFKDFIDYKEVRKIQDVGGIRIEDDYLLTENDITLLGEPLPKELNEIEEIRRNVLS